MKSIVKQLIEKEIANLHDNAYRYRHIGGTPRDIAYAKELEAKIEELKKELES